MIGAPIRCFSFAAIVEQKGQRLVSEPIAIRSGRKATARSSSASWRFSQARCGAFRKRLSSRPGSKIRSISCPWCLSIDMR